MTYHFTQGEIADLASPSGQDALEELSTWELSKTARVSDIAAARRRFGQLSSAMVETVLLRRKAQEKSVGADHWLYTDEALQQATPSPVARHRAKRLRDHAVHDMTCSIGAELTALTEISELVLASDLDSLRLTMARHNHQGRAVSFARADALRPASRKTVLLADPARRSSAKRTLNPHEFQPPLHSLFTACAGRELVVKCAPGIDFQQLRADGFHGEIELISWKGSVREAALWSPGLSTVSRRASILDKSGTCEEISDVDPDECLTREVGQWIIDPDPAVIRAGLVRHYGYRHRLWQIDPHLAYLSGDECPPGVRGFEVLLQLPYSEKKLSAALRSQQVGIVEILSRGIEVDPAQLRKRLSLQGTLSMTVILARIGDQHIAYLCRPNR